MELLEGNIYLIDEIVSLSEEEKYRFSPKNYISINEQLTKMKANPNIAGVLVFERNNAHFGCYVKQSKTSVITEMHSLILDTIKYQRMKDTLQKEIRKIQRLKLVMPSFPK